MRFNFKKISALATSTLLVGMTMGVAAAATYPAPFIQGSNADVAIVYGTGTGVSIIDGVQAGSIQADLQSRFIGDGGGDGDVVTGESYPLFTDTSKVYMNDTLSVRSILTDQELKTVLADSKFEGNVNADVTQTIYLGSNPRVVYGKHPSSGDSDPTVALTLGNSAANYIYNATVGFNKAVNLADSESIGSKITIFGQEFTVGAGTTNTTLYLFKSSQKVDLSIGGSNPAEQQITVEGKTYTVTLTGATDTSATIKVTDSTGASETEKVNLDDSETIQGLEVAVTLSASSQATSSESATIIVGSNKLKLTDASNVEVGTDEDNIENTNFVIAGAGFNATTGFTVQVFEEDSEKDAVVAGGSFVDPVFGTFKIDFPALNIPDTSTARENIAVKAVGNDKASVAFTDHQGMEKTIDWYYNVSTTPILADSDGKTMKVIEMAAVNKSGYVVVGNEEEGYLLKLTEVTNQTGTADDKVVFTDVFSDDKYEATISSTEGSGTLTVGGKSYGVTYAKVSGQDSYAATVRLNYPDSTDDAIIYPTIETDKGAKLFFYEPQTITLTSWDGTNSITGNEIRFPDGDGYTDVTFTWTGNCTVVNGSSCAGTGGTQQIWNVTAGGTTDFIWGAVGSNANVTIGQLTYAFYGSATQNTTTVYLRDPTSGAIITTPVIGFFEEQDDSSSKLYNGGVVVMSGAGSSTSPVSVSDVELTWGSDGYWDEIQTETDEDLYKSMDYYGTIVTTDRSDSDSYAATISYPDSQIYPKLYVGEVASQITTGTPSSGGGSLGNVLVRDSEVSSVNTKNLIVVGGSCINTAAATLVGGSYCGEQWTTATGIGMGQYMIKGFTGTSLTSKIALLVAGYNVEDTVNAATFLKTQVVDTSKNYKGTTATSAEEVVTSA